MSARHHGVAVESTLMFQEAASGAASVREQLRLDAKNAEQIGAYLRAHPPRLVLTCARGSSDHAATYAKYLIETQLGVVVASASPAVSSVYHVAQDLRDCLFLAISQSGRSPDLLASVGAAAAAGATILALCNDSEAPLVAAADFYLPLRAGPELSVAATKSYLATLAALTRLVAVWTGSDRLQRSTEQLPSLLADAWQLDWSAAHSMLVHAEHLYVIGRGFGLGLAQEVALKCKETCALHAEAFSSAELRHGPFTLLGSRFPALVFAQNDASKPGLETLIAELCARELPIIVAGAGTAGNGATGPGQYAARTGSNAVFLPTLDCAAELAPILLASSAYRLLASLALRRGLDPDHPPHLNKVTSTL